MSSPMLPAAKIDSGAHHRRYVSEHKHDLWDGKLKFSKQLVVRQDGDTGMFFEVGVEQNLHFP